jgi:RNA 2',3'-cyclic 3'-phosphodiesterase
MTGPRKPDSGGKLKLSNTKSGKLASAKSELSKIRSHSGKPAPKRAKPEYVDETQSEPSSTRPSGAERGSGAPSRAGQGRPERSGSGGPSRPSRDRPEQGKAGRDRPKRPADISRSGNSKSGKSGKPAPGFAPDTHEARPRLFYALHIPGPVADALATAQKELRGNWRAVQPDQLHITLAYLPSTDPARLSDFKALGEALSLGTAPLTIKLRGTGYHPNEGSPRVWFVKVESEGDGLDALAGALRSGIAELGAETDNQPFKAHITLARKKGPAPRAAPIIFETVWEAPTLTLYRSHLQKTGPVYENLASFRFRGTIMSSAESAPIISANQDQASQDQPDPVPSPEDTP